ncbi:MAG TPA: hypothetical protein VG893_09945 [Terracidiphilus sp.]|nr:hypothetical protein [Terracidiphilus sp.]
MLRRIGQWTLRIAAALAVAAVLLYLGDWAVFQMRGSPQATVHVSRLMVVPLNNGKQEYDYEGTFDEPCSLSLFPQGGMNACWRLRRNPAEVITV